MVIVPLLDTFNQTINIALGGQSCTINLRQTTQNGLYFTLYVAGQLVIGGVVCENLNLLIRGLYFGFQGDFSFYDTQGTSDPSSPGLGARYQLCYLSLADLGGIG